MPYTREEQKLRTIHTWQRIFLRHDEKKANPNLPHMWNDEWERRHQDLLEAQYEEAATAGLHTGICKIHCAGCRRVFYTTVPSKKYCNYATCGMKVFKIHQRMKRWKNRCDSFCQECGRMFTPKRSDAKYCSNACRQKAYRSRQSGSQ